MRLIGIFTALNPATLMALSISGRGSSLEAGAGPTLAETFERLAELSVLNGTGCLTTKNELSKQKRADLASSCANNQQQVNAALAQCVKLATNAEKAARDGSRLFQQYFDTNDANTRNEVAQSFAKIAAGCGNDRNQRITVECTPDEPCTPPQNPAQNLVALATGSGGSGSIRLCRPAFRQNLDQDQSESQNCGDVLTNMGELLVHEMSHLTIGTFDIAYGKPNAVRLPTSESLRNADNYALFARDVTNNCGGTSVPTK